MLLIGTTVTIVLVLLTRIAGKKYDSYLIGIYGASQALMYFLIWVMGVGTSISNWWANSGIHNFFSWIQSF